MTKEELNNILSQGEGLRIEFKEARQKVPASLYESIVSFLNTIGFDKFFKLILHNWVEKMGKLQSLKVFENKEVIDFLQGKGGSRVEKGGKLFDKRTEWLFFVLLSALKPISLSELTRKISYSKGDKFKEMYMTPLMTYGLLAYTIPEKPNSPKQQYVTTQKGILFLGGFEI